jgi:hypothetical protein
MESEQTPAKTDVSTGTYRPPAGIIDGSVTGGGERLKLVFTVIMPKISGNPRHGCNRVSEPSA